MFSPSYAPFDPTDKTGYETVLKRWPVILTSIIDAVYSVNHELTTLPNKAAKLDEGKALIAAISRLKYDMARDRALEPIPADGEALIDEYNAELANTWFTAPWLYADTQHWKSYDPFFAQKLNTYQASGTAVHHLAATLAELESEKDILVNIRRSSKRAWEHIMTLKDARIDFVLDNGELLLFTDLVFADFLVSYIPYVSKVVFHPKSIPWFVSDVTPPDFSALLDASSLPPGPAPEYLERAIARWNGYLFNGTFSLSVPRDADIGTPDESVNFWTSPWPYWDMRLRAPKVWDALRESGLVIFKPHFFFIFRSYRKLTGDLRWPVDTPFETAVGPLARSFPLLSLRTNKADVAVGIPRSVAEALDARGEKWRVNGRYVMA
ncbi:hypothetical protein B0F90DRAFT_1742372 [Multifurca ochricompacta]|uniref:Sugar phosphate phosphatase n=1 Tax=Multifurca ochricompacta TaxID=376703 RepID=A0AAD4M0L9_9AGAM|nr:hypothetical protein B0F90DRAFT_1742372 [Multifurca ochricompacta]